MSTTAFLPHRQVALPGTRGRRSSVVLGLALATLLAGCGGGELEQLVGASAGNIPHCADFQYQEDAQAAYEQGLTFLDGDADGIACEGRPRRNAPGNTAQTAGTTTLATLLTADGSTHVVTQSSGQVELASELGTGVTGHASREASTVRQLDPTTAEVTAPTVLIRFALATQRTTAAWTQRVNAPVSLGFGVAGVAASKVADVAGSYRALGQQCAADGTDCRPVVATLVVGADAALTVCPGAEYSATCANRERRTLSSSPLGAGVWRIGNLGESLIGHRATGAVALTYRTTAGVVALYGYKDSFVSTILSPGPSLSFDASGQVASSPLAFAQTPITANQPLQGIFRNSAGDLALASTTGHVVTWVANAGMRFYWVP